MESREEVNDKARTGQSSPCTVNINLTRVKGLLNTNRLLNIHLLSQLSDISKTITNEIVTDDLNVRKVCPKMVPQVHTDDQKVSRIETCQGNLNICENDSKFLNNMITGDDFWIFEHYPYTKSQWLTWRTPESSRSKKVRISCSKIKTTLIVFFDIKGQVYHDFVPHSTTVNAKFYVQLLKRLKRKV